MKHKVFLTGGDEHGWAIDEDLKLTRRSLEPIVELIGLEEAEIVHACWWFGLLGHDPEKLMGKRIICHVPGEPFRYFADPEHKRAMPLVGRWITRTQQAHEQLRSVGIYSDIVPYFVDTALFRPIDSQVAQLRNFRDEHGIPEQAYLIGNFQRDTEGKDLRSPKLVKGPDIFLEILLELQKRNLPVHVLLAGPRRQWIILKLKEFGIPFTYVGTFSQQDDLHTNLLSREDLNLLYNAVDLCVVSSRTEGGPHAVIEAGASKCKIISTYVGMAPEVMARECLYRLPSEAANIIQRDIQNGYLERSLEQHYSYVLENMVPEASINKFGQIYSEIDKAFVYWGKPCAPKAPTRSKEKPVKVGLWHSFFKPPYGGGNQFMLALKRGLLSKGIEIAENQLDESIDAYVLNSIHFDVDRFLEFSRKHRINVVHRIDGPISLIRGYDREKDELCYSLNEQFASATVLQSNWVYQKIIELGYNPISPTIIHNAVDSDIFHSSARIPFERTRKIRLISSSWSNNPRKGGPLYKWLEDNLDWDRFDYTFVGNASTPFERIRQIQPVPSEELADLLREHDIYITASQNDPCSNALIEALACGCPALYLNDGGHPELTGYGGLPFSGEGDVMSQLDLLVENYEPIQRLITTASLSDTAEKYLRIIREIIQ